MKRITVPMLCCCLTNPAIVGAASEHQSAAFSLAETRARSFIEEIVSIGLDEFRRRNGSDPLSRDVRAAILGALPAEGALVPTRAERLKLSALDRVFDRYGRLGSIDVKVVDVRSALVGLHKRAVLLITRQALALVTPRELEAIGAHELAHEYFWKEFDIALNANDYQRLQELELRCDGIAVMTLRSLGVDRSHLIHAAIKLTRYNERTAAAIMTARQVSLERRITFIKQLDAYLGTR
jgi:hypothetical protein